MRRLVAVLGLLALARRNAIFRFTARVRGLTLEAPFQGPVTVRITHGNAIDRVGTIGACDAAPTALFGVIMCRPGVQYFTT